MTEERGERERKVQLLSVITKVLSRDHVANIYLEVLYIYTLHTLYIQSDCPKYLSSHVTTGQVPLTLAKVVNHQV